MKRKLTVAVVLGMVGFSLHAAAWAQPQTQDTFVEPEVRRAVNGTLDTVLRLAYEEQIIGKDTVRLRNYEGSLVGPTLRFRAGDRVKVHLFNQLPATDPVLENCKHAHNGHGCNTTNIHTHGLHVSPVGNSDNVLVTIKPGEDFQYVFDIPNDHPAGTFWYHPHLHGTVAVQVGSGVAGALIIEGGLDEVPAIKAAKERLFVFQQIPYDAIEKTVEWENANLGQKPYKRYTTINGSVQPILVMRPGEVQRWRFIHAGIKEELQLSLEQHDPAFADLIEDLVAPPAQRGAALEAFAEARSTALEQAAGNVLPMYMIAYDGIALGRRDSLDTVKLDAGNRADVLVKAPLEAGTYTLTKNGIEKEKAARELEVGPDILAWLVVKGEHVNMSLPDHSELAALAPFPDIKEEELTGYQETVFDFFTVNGISFKYPPAKPEDVLELELNDVEEWKLSSKAGNHPFHIHVNPFQVIEIGGEKLKFRRWQDTILVKKGEAVIIRTRYRVFTGEFVMHCHFLDHEDQGMMRLVRIVK